MPVWSESLRLGVSAIDEEHLELFRVCERLNGAVAGGEYAAAADLVFLGRYLDEHFAHEEALMVEASYPRGAEHRQEHARYRSALSRLLAKPMTEAGLLQEIAQSVTTWLLFHIQQEDRALARHLVAR